jgi:ATP-dependent DNA helicase RecG
MAPTEVLAQQHAATLHKSLASSRVRVALLTGSLSRSQRNETIAQLAAGEIDLLVGTQALLSEEIQFKNLGLVIVDEQHKFGVVQRAKLRTESSERYTDSADHCHDCLWRFGCVDHSPETSWTSVRQYLRVDH